MFRRVGLLRARARPRRVEVRRRSESISSIRHPDAARERGVLLVEVRLAVEAEVHRGVVVLVRVAARRGRAARSRCSSWSCSSEVVARVLDRRAAHDLDRRAGCVGRRVPRARAAHRLVRDLEREVDPLGERRRERSPGGSRRRSARDRRSADPSTSRARPPSTSRSCTTCRPGRSACRRRRCRQLRRARARSPAARAARALSFPLPGRRLVASAAAAARAAAGHRGFLAEERVVAARALERSGSHAMSVRESTARSHGFTRTRKSCSRQISSSSSGSRCTRRTSGTRASRRRRTSRATCSRSRSTRSAARARARARAPSRFISSPLHEPAGRLDLLAQLVDVARAEARVHVAHDARAIDQIGRRHRLQAERLGQSPCGIAHARVADLVLREQTQRLLRVLCRRSPRSPGTDPRGIPCAAPRARAAPPDTVAHHDAQKSRYTTLPAVRGQGETCLSPSSDCAENDGRRLALRPRPARAPGRARRRRAVATTSASALVRTGVVPYLRMVCGLLRALDSPALHRQHRVLAL